MAQYQPFDMDAYIDRARNGPCFVCEMLAGNPDYQHHIIYESETAVAFLNKYPKLYGYTLVAPKKHREQVTGDFSIEEYLALQRFIFCVAEALRQTVPTERIYLLSLGSQQGNRRAFQFSPRCVSHPKTAWGWALAKRHPSGMYLKWWRRRMPIARLRAQASTCAVLRACKRSSP